MPRVHATFDGYLATFHGGGFVQVPEGGTARDLAASVGISGYHVGAILVNGVPSPDRPLQEGDRVEVVPLVCGG